MTFGLVGVGQVCYTLIGLEDMVKTLRTVVDLDLGNRESEVVLEN
jgi:hypothetical protein